MALLLTNVIYAYFHLHKLQVLVWYWLLNIRARSWYWVYYIKQYPPGPGIKSFLKLSFWLDHHIGFIRASTQTLSMWPGKNISHITVLDTNFFPIPPIKLKLGLHVDERLLIATHLDQSNYLAKQKQGHILSWRRCSTHFLAGMRQVYIYHWNWNKAHIHAWYLAQVPTRLVLPQVMLLAC